ncbi:MAG: NADPH-dependent 7-cyano-7-deazaguanine reductase QueF [Gammaproteobacteria bacterium]|nr:NADPH-dependent 7-cyano-7-deazaguanine reductase QueF [Gammaproteobacteria bacterium]
MEHSGIPLGKQTSYPQQYDPAQLYRVARSDNRALLPFADARTGSADLSDKDLPFFGFDHWRAYELSWLQPSGKPVVATADIIVPCDSPNLIESKSMKLYFNSLNQHKLADMQEASELIARDLSLAAGKPVQVRLHPLTAGEHHTSIDTSAVLLDELQIATEAFSPDAALLAIREDSSGPVSERLRSELFRSNCPITSQPDWGSITIEYTGQPINHESLLRYIISYRQHEGFHEHCVEMIFCDLMKICRPQSLTVSINFLRRGGLEINPLRTTRAGLAPQSLPRELRQ